MDWTTGKTFDLDCIKLMAAAKNVSKPSHNSRAEQDFANLNLRKPYLEAYINSYLHFIDP